MHGGQKSGNTLPGKPYAWGKGGAAGGDEAVMASSALMPKQ